MRYNKLVRDRIGEILAREGKQYTSRIAGNEEYAAKLQEKLMEEVGEFLEGGKAEELADILEVVYALADHKSISRDALEELRLQKSWERGGFSRRIILEEVGD